MQSLFTTNAHNEIINRLGQLEENQQPLWGKMSAGQMVKHCQFPLHVILEKKDFNLKPNWIVNLLFKKSMYSDKPWRKNMPTVKRFKVEDPVDFSSEKQKLHDLIEELHTHSNRTEWQPHPSFGTLTAEQWGKMQYKHLDHHFKQFGV